MDRANKPFHPYSVEESTIRLVVTFQFRWGMNGKSFHLTNPS
jgi:hypothetical protein